MLSQFICSHDLRVLGQLDFVFPAGTHAIGRLDYESEGVLLLTTNKKVTRLLFQGEIPHKRSYLVKVKYEVNEATLQRLRNGVAISAKQGLEHITSPCDVTLVKEPENLFHHDFETKDYVPYSWLLINLTEGRFHQVRKMVAGVGHKCRRLIRVAIEDLELNGLQPGEVREFEEETFFRLLRISNWQ